MNTIFAQRRARLLEMKTLRERYVPADQTVCCRPAAERAIAGTWPGIWMSAPGVDITSPSARITGSARCWTPARSGN